MGLEASRGHDPKTLQAAVQAVAEFDGELSFRPMFGGIMAYAGCRPFASLSNRGLALKLGPGDQDVLRARLGARPLRYEPDDPPSRSYTLVPDAMLGDAGTLAGWIGRSIAFAASLPAKKPKRRAT